VIANGGDWGDADEARAVRDQLLRAAVRTPAMLKLSNVEKQKGAEWIAYQVVMDAALNDSFTRKGDVAKLQVLRAQVREAAMRLGPDPTKLKLTKAGFVPAP
jgi:hypothetical protein